MNGVPSKVVGLNSKQFRLRRVVADVHFRAKLASVLHARKVHGKLNTHTGAAHGTDQRKRKFFPELLIGLDIGARFDSQLKEFTYGIQGKNTLPVTDNGLLSVDLKVVTITTPAVERLHTSK